MRIRLVIGVVLVTLVMPFVVASPVLGMTGSGTEGDPYIISDVGDLQDMDLDLDAYYELGCDIDASATSGWNGGAGFEPVGDGATPFIGNFDGNGYVISDLWIDRDGSNKVGLFGQLHTSASLSGHRYVRDVYLDGATVYAEAEAGVLAGAVNSNDDTRRRIVQGVIVTGGYVESAETDGGSFGGLIGYITGHSQVRDCYFQGSMDVYWVGDYGAGGLVGRCGGDVWIYRCGTNVDIVAYSNSGNVGGLIGYVASQDIIIEECYSYGIVDCSAVTATYRQVGGLVARGTGTVLNSYSRCTVIGVSQTSYRAAGLLTMADEVAAEITKCYSTGSVSGATITSGLIAYLEGTCTESFWDTETSGQLTSAGGTGKTTAQMKTQSTFTSAGWDFDTIWAIGGYVNDGYPYLQWWYDPYPFADYDVYQVQWFEPVAIISGTTLPDRTSTQNGVITWGANPGGISIVMGELVSEDQPLVTSSPEYPTTSIPDMTGESGQPGWTSTQPTLTDHPFYPLVSMVSDNTNIPVWLVWMIVALLILFIIMMVSFRYAPHQLITAFAGGGWSAFMYHMGIFPFWVMFIFAVMAAAIIIGERTPTVS